jgi:hypothetical protein
VESSRVEQGGVVEVFIQGGWFSLVCLMWVLLLSVFTPMVVIYVRLWGFGIGKLRWLFYIHTYHLLTWWNSAFGLLLWSLLFLSFL